MSIRKLIYIASVCTALVPLRALAQEPAPIIKQIEESGLIKINAPQALMPILSFNEAEAAPRPEEAAEQTKTARVGYRVQVFDDNNPRTAKQQAEERRNMIISRFPEFRGYVTFNSPYWRVKVGDFRTRSEAEAAMGAIRAAFPNIGPQLRVVRDKINPR